jgi:hypothetical protein
VLKIGEDSHVGADPNAPTGPPFVGASLEGWREALPPFACHYTRRATREPPCGTAARPVSRMGPTTVNCQVENSRKHSCVDPATSDGRENEKGSDPEKDRHTVQLPRSSAAPFPSHVHVQGPCTRLQIGITKPKQYTGGTIRYDMFSSIGEPETLLKLSRMIVGLRQCVKNIQLKWKIKHGVLFHQTPRRI